MKNICHYTTKLSLFVLLISINMAAMDIKEQTEQSHITEQNKTIHELANRVNNLEKAMGSAQATIQELKDSFDQKINRLKQSIGSTQEIINNTDEKLNALADQVDRMSLSDSQ